MFMTVWYNHACSNAAFSARRRVYVSLSLLPLTRRPISRPLTKPPPHRQGEAGVTQERILVLFFFLSDCVVSTIRRHAWNHLRRLIEWSLRYIVERVCALVQEAGGWVSRRGGESGVRLRVLRETASLVSGYLLIKCYDQCNTSVTT